MTVYVDDMYLSHLGFYRSMRMSHMIGDDDDELHAMAARIGVQRRWFQGDHHDICLSKRELAVAAGAISITMRQAACMVRRKKVEGILGKPEEAIAWRRALSARAPA